MKYAVTAIALNEQQLDNLYLFRLGLAPKENSDGTYLSMQYFSSISEARQHLKEFAEDYYSGNKTQIKQYLGKNTLIIGDITARIVKFK